MQHYTTTDKMLTIHEDRLIKDWTLKKAITPKDAQSVFDFYLGKLPCFDSAGREIPNLYHIERMKKDETSGEILPIGGFGANYTILQHSDMLNMIADKILPALPGSKIETVGTLEGGATGMVQISCGKDFKVAGDDSRQESRIYFNNPVGGGSLVMGFCLTRCICENTIALARKEVLKGVENGTGFSIRHTTNIDAYAQMAIAQIVEQAKASKVMQERIKALASKSVNAATVRKALAELIPATPQMANETPAAYTIALNKRDEVITQWESGETAETFKTDSAWKLVNAFTFPIFNPQKITKGSDLSGIRYDGLFGDRADKVANIFATVERLAA